MFKTRMNKTEAVSPVIGVIGNAGFSVLYPYVSGEIDGRDS